VANEYTLKEHRSQYSVLLTIWNVLPDKAPGEARLAGPDGGDVEGERGRALILSE
jgi:hypothetical protein